jgi:hypothetical protein
MTVMMGKANGGLITLLSKPTQLIMIPNYKSYTGKKYSPTNGRCWVTNKETIAKWIEEGRIFFGKDGKGAPQLKIYLNGVQQGTVPMTVLIKDMGCCDNWLPA